VTIGPPPSAGLPEGPMPEAFEYFKQFKWRLFKMHHGFAQNAVLTYGI
jgi:hypothetical protein